MDLLKTFNNEATARYTSEFDYQTNFLLDEFFPSVKTEDLIIELEKISKNGDLPTIALVHANDTETRIGDRPNYERLQIEQLLIKEKINLTENQLRYKSFGVSENSIEAKIYDDFANLISSVLARVELERCQLLSTGKIEIDENNIKTTVNFGYDSSHNDNFTGWSDPTHDIIADLEAIKAKANAEGKVITRALTSSKIVGYITKNNAIKEIFAKSLQIPTASNILNWINANFGIVFVTNDALYKEKHQGATQTHRFFPENVISFFTGEGTIGTTLYGHTTEELEFGVENSGLVTLSQWKTPDPVAVWSKASAIAIPVMNDIDGLFIVKVSA